MFSEPWNYFKPINAKSMCLKVIPQCGLKSKLCHFQAKWQNLWHTIWKWRQFFLVTFFGGWERIKVETGSLSSFSSRHNLSCVAQASLKFIIFLPWCSSARITGACCHAHILNSFMSKVPYIVSSYVSLQPTPKGTSVTNKEQAQRDELDGQVLYPVCSPTPETLFLAFPVVPMSFQILGHKMTDMLYYLGEILWITLYIQVIFECV